MSNSSYLNSICTSSILNQNKGSQYRCGWVGRGIQPPSTLQVPHSHTQNASKTLDFALFDGPTDGRTNGPTDRQTTKSDYAKLLQKPFDTHYFAKKNMFFSQFSTVLITLGKQKKADF